MKTLLEHSPEIPYTKNNGQTLSTNGLRKLINMKFLNKSLEEARDLWVLSFILMGLDVREILTAKKDEAMPGIFLVHKDRENTIPLPLHDIGMEIIQKYGGNIYLLKFIEAGGIPGRIEGHRKASRIRFDLNRRMDMITNFLGFECKLPFESTRMTWILITKDHKVDGKVINIMSDFTANVDNRKSLNGSLENIAGSNNGFLDFIFGIKDEIGPNEKQYPQLREDGSKLLYRREG